MIFKYFKRTWKKSNIITTLKSLGVVEDNAIIMVDFLSLNLIDELININKKLTHQQINIIMSICCIIYYNEKTKNNYYQKTLELLFKGFRFQVYKNFNNENLKISFLNSLYTTINFLNNQNFNMNNVEKLVVEKEKSIFNLEILRKEFEK